MNSFQLIKQNLLYFRKKNFSLALGIAISAAVITGSLIVGDSVRYSLNSIVKYRLGKISHVVKSGDRYFSYNLAGNLAADLDIPTSAALQVEGIGVGEGGKARIGNVQVLGVDKNFDGIAGLKDYYGRLSGDETILSSNLADRLGLKLGDEILLRLIRASLIPMNAPFVSDRENVVSVRLRIVAIAGKEEMGRLNLNNSQTAAFNAFVSYDKLCDLMDFREKANLIFLSANEQLSVDQLSKAIREHWTLSDAGLKIEHMNNLKEINLTCDRVFIDDVVSGTLLQAEGMKYPVLTYFVNFIRSKGKYTPYSFVSSLTYPELSENEVIINDWLANDLDAGPGDSLEMEYFIVGPLRELSVQKKSFKIKSVEAMKGYFADEKLMPDLPGLSDAGNCRDWETGIPIQLEKIRDKDEDYWKKWKGTPKAFISLSTAKVLWENRFGSYTGFRYSQEMTTESRLSASVMPLLSPENLGIKLEEVRQQGELAARNGVDFSELFIGLSFFLLAGGIILTILLFLLNLESRKEQIMTISGFGIPMRTIRRIILIEGMIISFLGSLFGLFIAVIYNRLIFSALNGIWKDIVRTDIMIVDIRLKTLITGLIITLFISWITLLFPLNNFLKNRLIQIQKRKKSGNEPKVRRLSGIIFIFSGLVGIILIAAQLLNGELVNESYFFLSGSLMLVSGVTGFYFLLKRPLKSSETSMSLRALSRKFILRNPARSMSIVILFSIGSFLVVSTGSNRKDLFRNAELKSSGTGGFLYYAESTVPVLRDLNDPELRYEYGLSENYKFYQLRVTDGDDASCLNLNRVLNPVILGIDPKGFKDRFNFVTKTPLLDDEDPWGSLMRELPGGLVPAIADETVIKWGLGLKVGDTLSYINSKGKNLKLLLIGGLAPSIFQGNVIISNKHFLREFPENNGTGVFLIEGLMQDTAMIIEETDRGMRDFGWDMNLTSVRLSEFNSVTNTYLSIFMVMGALGLLLGTIGLAIILLRSIMERKQEIALFRAIGFSKRNIRKLIVEEYMILLSIGVCIGFITAVIATLPSILSQDKGGTIPGIIIIFLALLINGWLWTFILASQGLRNKSVYESLRND